MPEVVSPARGRRAPEVLTPEEPGGLRLRGLRVSYGGVEALRGLDLDVRPGRLVGLVGANGAGKSSALRAAMGLVPGRGSVEAGGRELLGSSASRRAAAGVSFVPEGRGVVTTMTVEENLLLGAYRRRSRALAASRREVCDLFPVLHERRAQSAGTLSGGEQQMLAVGRALMARPSILVLDEPSMGLAPVIATEVFRALRTIADGSAAVLVSDENARLVLGVADHVHVLRLGEVVAEGPPEHFADAATLGKHYFGG